MKYPDDNGRPLSGEKRTVDIQGLLEAYAQDRRNRGLPMIPEQEAPARSRVRWLAWSLVPVSAVLLVVAFKLYQADTADPGQRVVEAIGVFNSTTVEALDPSGERVWLRDLGGKVGYPRLLRDDEGQPTAFLAVTLDGVQSKLHALDAFNGEIRWTRSATFANSEIAAGPFRYTETRWLAWPGQEAIIATVLAGRWYHTAIQSLDAHTGELLGTYYHPGHLHYGQPVDLDNDGVPTFVLYGDNSSARYSPNFVPFESERHCGTIVLLDPHQFGGQAFPYSEPKERPDWPEVEPARERAYLCIAPIDPGIDANVAAVSVDAGSTNRLARIEARLADGRIVIMNGELEPESVYLVLDQQAEVMNREQLLESNFVYLVDGEEKWISLPVQWVASLEGIEMGR